MTDVNTIALGYIDLGTSGRLPAAARCWRRTGPAMRYIDPLMSGDGHDGVDALIAGVQQRFPDFRFRLLGRSDGFGDHVRFSWGLGPDGVDSPIKGTDFAVVSDGRIKSITGFLDQVPQGA